MRTRLIVLDLPRRARARLVHRQRRRRLVEGGRRRRRRPRRRGRGEAVGRLQDDPGRGRRRGEDHHHVGRHGALVLPPHPAGYAEAPLPVVLDLHGYSEGATVHEMMSSLGPFGDEHDFVTITPQGQGPVARWDTEPRLGRHDVHR